VTVPTAAKLRAILAEILESAAGGDAPTWWLAIGEVETLPVSADVSSNWSVNPEGTPEQLAAIEKAVEAARAAHPYVAG
jgi:hypothetical protein